VINAEHNRHGAELQADVTRTMESEFLGRHGLRESWHLEEVFDAVKAPLFQAVVLNRIDLAGNAPHVFWQYLPDFMSCRRFPRRKTCRQS